MTFDSLLSARQSSPARLFGALVALLTVTLLSVSLTFHLSWKLEGSAAAINDLGNLRMESYRLVNILQRAQPGADAAGQLDLIAGTLARLRDGDLQRPLLLPPSAAVQGHFGRLMASWHGQLRPAAIALPGLGAELRAPALVRVQGASDNFVAQAGALAMLVEQDSQRRRVWLRVAQAAALALALAGIACLAYLAGSGSGSEDALANRGDGKPGQLMRGFNQMGERIKTVYGTLEGLVALKTATLERQNRELALLYDASAFLQRPQALEAMCQEMLERICDYFDAEGGIVRLLDAGRNNLHVVARQGAPAVAASGAAAGATDDCMCSDSVVKMAGVVPGHCPGHQPHEAHCPRQRFATVAVFHIDAQQVHLGFFSLHFRQPKTFDEREHSLLETLGQLLGTAVENLRLGAREREMAVFEERSLMAQGLHDSIAQGLNFLNLQVQMLDQSVRDKKLKEVAEIVPLLRAGVQESYEDVRELLINFRSSLAEGSLIGALATSVAKFRRQTGIAAELVADVDGAPLPREQQLQLLFIAQEALSNVRKHADAGSVVVRVQDGHDFTLSITDDGVGFDTAHLDGQGEHHVGIHIMRERARRIESALTVSSAPGSGTTVTLTLPHAQRRAA